MTYEPPSGGVDRDGVRRGGGHRLSLFRIAALLVASVGALGFAVGVERGRDDADRAEAGRDFQAEAAGAFEDPVVQPARQPASADAASPTTAPPVASSPTTAPPYVRAYDPVEPIALLEIPKIGLSQVMVEGDGTQDMRAALDHGPAHYNGMALPGQPGNVGVAGHRTTVTRPFNRLDELVAGDEIVFTYVYDANGGEQRAQFRYVVTSSAVGSPDDPDIQALLGEWGDNRVTLTTCHPPGSAAERLIVVGHLVP